jgi:hypothetical protein
MYDRYDNYIFYNIDWLIIKKVKKSKNFKVKKLIMIYINILLVFVYLIFNQRIWYEIWVVLEYKNCWRTLN